MALHALELVLDADSDALIRAEWHELAAAGLPSQARHRGATNAPHITILAAPVIDEVAQERAVAALVPLLPARIDLAGIALLGRGPYAFTRLLAPDAALESAVAGLRDAVPNPHSPGWTAHVTLARRLPTRLVSAALDAVATGPASPRAVVAAGLRRWNPDTGTTRLLGGEPAPDQVSPSDGVTS